MNRLKRHLKTPLHPLTCVAAGVAVGAVLGGLDCVLQGQAIRNQTSFWRWSELTLLIPAVFAIVGAFSPFSIRFWLFATPIPQAFQAATMTIQNVVRGVALDAVLYRHIFLVGIVYFFICLVPAAIGAIARYLWCRKPIYPPGCCEKCGYNLTGNVSGSCPECGNACSTTHLPHGP